MPSRPRHGRDYRKRTPRNTDLVQDVSSITAPVVMLDVNQTDSLQLVIDFNAPILSSVDASCFYVTLDSDVTAVIDNPLNGAAAASATVETLGVPTGQGRVTVTWDGGDLAPTGGVINPAASFVVLAAIAPDCIKFAGRLPYTIPHGQIAVIDPA